MSRPEQLTELDLEELRSILDRTEISPLSADDRAKLEAVVESFAWIWAELEEKNTSLARLRKSFSITTKMTEKTAEILQEGKAAGRETAKQKLEKSEPKGHGRHGAAAYKGAERIQVPVESISSGDSCPECLRGKVYSHEPKRLVRLKGCAPIGATVWEIEGLRCNLCGEIVRPDVPEEAVGPKYDESAASMIALLKYGSGLPFHRLAGLQRALEIPLSASTQWDVIQRAADGVAPAFDELTRQAAQASLFYNDDTTVKILTLLEENRRAGPAGAKRRTGIFTSAILARSEHLIALFFTGRRHAGENLADVLERRAAELENPIQMCDGASRNQPVNVTTEMANCLAHGRRKFVEVIDSFPEPCRHVLKVLAKVYKNDAVTRKKKMSATDRWRFHKKHSAKLMARLHHWMDEQLRERKVEPNSSLGVALTYMLRRWGKLTLFLRKVGAPLDNNLCEIALKKAILHRKNALFYKTQRGARTGDMFMSLIYTAEMAGANPLDYLTQLLKHGEALKSAAHNWMPWNYRDAVSAVEAGG